MPADAPRSRLVAIKETASLHLLKRQQSDRGKKYINWFLYAPGVLCVYHHYSLCICINTLAALLTPRAIQQRMQLYHHRRCFLRSKIYKRDMRL
jgi:hypothetical protein